MILSVTFLMNSISLPFFCLLLYTNIVHGTIWFANYYQDHMVLQRAPERAIVWGYTDIINSPITLTMNNQVYQTTSSSSINAANASIWAVQLDAQTEEDPVQIKVTQPGANGTKETIVLNDVLFGDVWICSGQSNMEFPVNRMFNASVEIENAHKYPKVRLFTASRQQSFTPEEELLGVSLHWSVASSKIVGSAPVSAVCWIYGRMIHEALGGRPIGLIHSSWGGTGIEFWSPPQALKACDLEESTTDDDNLDSNSSVEILLNKTVLYNAMIHPFTRMVIKGVIWYQGEYNIDHNRDKYNCSFAKLIEYWRDFWHARTNSSTDPQFPFGFVQLATDDPTGTRVGGFPWIRWHQTFDVGYVPNDKVPNVFMAAALDLRDDSGTLHPRDKLDVGYRLSRSGLAVAYGFKNVTYLGPIIDNIQIAPDNRKISVTYTREASPKIELRNSHGFEICCNTKEICSSNDLMWMGTPATAVEGSPLTISLAVPKPCRSETIIGLRYLWKETPCLFKEAAVYNSEDSNIPSSPYLHYF